MLKKNDAPDGIPREDFVLMKREECAGLFFR